MKCFTYSVLAIMLMMGFAGCGQKNEKVFEHKVVLNSHPLVTPVPCDTNAPLARYFKMEWWPGRHQAMLDRAKQGNVDLIMIGDSITHGWEKGGKDAWDIYYGDTAMNMGFGGDGTQHVLWRLYNGEISGISPKLAVIMIGTNNSHSFTADQIADGIAAILQKLRTDLPKTKILLLAIFPNGFSPKSQPVIDQTNAIIKTFADDKHIFFLDINKIWLTPDGTINTKLMPDKLHPNTKGYELWAEAMEPTVEKLMGTKK